MKRFLLRWAINTLAVLVAVCVVPGLNYEKPLDLLLASLLLGILNAFVRPVLMFLSLPLLIFTLGIFTLFINALLLYFVGLLLQPHFYVRSFAGAFWGALIISIVSLVFNVITGVNRTQFRFEHRARPRDTGHDDGGPIIDV